METETETQPKKSAKNSKKRRKSTNNGPTATANVTLTTDKDTHPQSHTKSSTRAKAKSRKDSRKRGSSVDEIANTHQPIDDSGNIHNANSSSVPSTPNMTQNNILSANNPQHYPPAQNGPTTPSAMYRPYGNGANELTAGDVVPQPNAGSMNGPLHSFTSSQDTYDNYGTYGSNGQYTGAHSSKAGIRPHYPGQIQRYGGPPSGSTPTLNQLLTTPSRYIAHGNFPSYPSGHQMEYNQSNMTPAPGNINTPHWPSSQPRPNQYGSNQEQQNLEKHGMNMYSQQPAPQYPGPSPYNHSGHRVYPGPQRYPVPPSSSQHYNQQQQAYPPGMITPNSSHQYGPPVSRGHPSHGGAPMYSQPPYQQSTDPYYNQHQSRPMLGYNMPGPNSNYQQTVPAAVSNGPVDQGYQTGKMEASAAITQDQNMTGTKTPDSLSGSSSSGFQQQSGYHMKSPGPVTPQPPRTPISQTNMTPSPLTAPHPSISHLRGPLSAPGSPSPGGQTRINPLSPVAVRPSTPQQQAGSVMRSPSNHSDHAQSPMPGYGVNYSHHTAQQHSYASPQHSNPPTVPQNQQNMMSPSQTMPYSQMQNQGLYTPNHPSSASQIMGPPAVTTPSKPTSQPSTPGTPQGQGSYGGQQQPQQTGYAMQYSGYGYGPQPAMQGYPPQAPPTERRTSWQGPVQTQVTPQSPQLQAPPHVQNTNHGQMMPEQLNMPGQQQISYSASHQPNTAGQFPAGHPQYGQYGQGQQPPTPSANQQYPGQVASSASNSAALAAAQAAMAAAAHSAKNRSSFPKHTGGNFPGVGQTPPVANPPMQSSPQQRSLPFHPNYANVQTGSSSNSSMPPEAFPQDPSATGPVPQDANRNVHNSIPPVAPQHAGMHPHMQQPHVSMQPGYQAYPMQPGHPGYDNAGGMPASASYMTQSATPVYEGMQTPYEDPRQDARRQASSSSARSASQKLSALYEPDELGRKEFIDRVLQYWEGKELPLKHAPLMGRRTLDLFTLYQHVKKKGFMQEVTKAKEWPEISNAMGLGNTSTSGFTLKKQYCKYLYGFECRYERGESEPPEALARISEANRKKKQAVEQQQSKAADIQIENKPNGSHAAALPHPPHNLPPHPMQYGMQFPPGPYQHQSQHPGMGGSGIQIHQNYGGMQSPQMHPGPQYRYPGGPVPSEQMPPYGPPHQYPPQYPAHQRLPVGHLSQSGYPAQHSASGPSPRHPIPPNQMRPPYVPSSQSNLSQAAISLPPIIPSTNQPQMSSEPSLPPANNTPDIIPTSEPGTTGKEQPKTVESESVFSEQSQEALAEEKKSDTGTDSNPPVSTSAAENIKVTADAATVDSKSGTEKDTVESTPITAETPINTASSSTTSTQDVAPTIVTTTMALTTSSTAVTTAETVVTQSYPQPTAVRMASPNVPYKPNMALPHLGQAGMQRHVPSPGTNFRPPSQPVQLPQHGVQPPQHYPPQHYPPGQDLYNKQAYSKSNHDIYRTGYPPRGPPPGHYPYPNSPAHIRQSPGPQHHQLTAAPQGRPPHHQQPPPSHSPYRTPNNSASGVMSSHQYPGQGPFPHQGGYSTPPVANTNQFPGMKRPSATHDMYGPPNKIMRPDMLHMQQYPPGYGRSGPPGQPIYSRGGPDGTPGHHYPQGQPIHPQHTGPRTTHPSMHSGVVQNSSAPPMPPQPYPGYPQHYPPQMRRSHSGMSPVNPASVYSPSPNSSKMPRWKQSSSSIDATKSSRYPPGLVPDSAVKGLQGDHSLSPHPVGLPSRMSLPQPYPPPLSTMHQQFKGQQNYHRYHPPFKMDNISSLFPSGCVESTHPRFTKFRRKTRNDVGVHEAWNVIMALKSGLLAETIWALNTLTILLYDHQTIGQVILSQLPGLLHALVSRYRYCLKELFSLPEEIESCIGTMEVGRIIDKDFLEEEMKLYDVITKCQEDFKLNILPKRKYLTAPPNLVGVTKKFPVNLIFADDAHVIDREILWEGKTQSMKDTSHLVGTYHQNCPEDDEPEEIVEEQDWDQDHPCVLEATLEDILTVPSYIRSLEMEEDSNPVLGYCEVKEEPVIKEEESSVTPEPMILNDERERKSAEENEVNMVERLEKTIESMKTAVTKGEENVRLENAKEVSDLNVKMLDDEIGVRRNLHIQSCLERFSKNCDIVLLEDESAGCPGEDVVGMTRSGRFFGGNGSPPFRSKSQGNRETELTQMVLCLSNLFRSLSCSAINHAELSRHRDFMRALSGLLLLRHKHRLRPAAKPSDTPAPPLPSVVAKIKDLMEVKEISDTVVIKKEICEIVPESQMNGVISNPGKDENVEMHIKSLADDRVAENLINSQKLIKKENTTLENGYNNIGEILDHEEESSVSDKKQLTRESRKLRWAENGCDEMMHNDDVDDMKIEKGRNAVTRIKCNNNHDTVNHLRTKSKHGKNAIRLSNGPCKLKNDVTDRTEENEIIMAGNMQNSDCKPLMDSTVQTSGKFSVCDQVEMEKDEETCLDSEDLGKDEESKSSTEISELSECTKQSSVDLKETIKLERKRLLFSTTVLDCGNIGEKRNKVYSDTWWWDCVQQLREDSLVALANMSPYLDLAKLPDDGTVLAILDSCMHLVVCTSAEAQDPFSSMGPRATLSPRNLVIEILTKLSMKESNLDLILATRPYNRLEKLFEKLVVMVGDRKDQTLREFAIVLLSNLSEADCVAARAIALQKGAIANLIGFLEECEETGLNNRRMFTAGQERINCGTIPYMMKRCALTLLTLAKLRGNRSLFLKHQLRLLSLSMSSLLGGIVLTLLSSVLYEINIDAS